MRGQGAPGIGFAEMEARGRNWDMETRKHKLWEALTDGHVVGLIKAGVAPR